MRGFKDFTNVARRLASGPSDLTKAWEGLGGGLRGVSTELAVPDNAYLPYDVETIEATVREASGRLPSAKLRQVGRTPAMLVALDRNESLMLTVDSKRITSEVRSYGRTGLVSRIYTLRVLGDHPRAGEYRVLPRQVHMNAVSGMIENVNFLWCPPEKRLLVDIPVKVLGEETAPGVKRGGYLNIIRRTVLCSCPGWAIPPYTEIDASHLDVGERVTLEDLVLPEGVFVAEKHADHPVLKIAGKATRD